MSEHINRRTFIKIATITTASAAVLAGCDIFNRDENQPVSQNDKLYRFLPKVDDPLDRCFAATSAILENTTQYEPKSEFSPDLIKDSELLTAEVAIGLAPSTSVWLNQVESESPGIVRVLSSVASETLLTRQQYNLEVSTQAQPDLQLRNKSNVPVIEKPQQVSGKVDDRRCGAISRMLTQALTILTTRKDNAFNNSIEKDRKDVIASSMRSIAFETVINPLKALTTEQVAASFKGWTNNFLFLSELGISNPVDYIHRLVNDIYKDNERDEMLDVLEIKDLINPSDSTENITNRGIDVQEQILIRIFAKYLSLKDKILQGQATDIESRFVKDIENSSINGAPETPKVFHAIVEHLTRQRLNTFMQQHLRYVGGIAMPSCVIPTAFYEMLSALVPNGDGGLKALLYQFNPDNLYNQPQIEQSYTTRAAHAASEAPITNYLIVEDQNAVPIVVTQVKEFGADRQTCVILDPYTGTHYTINLSDSELYSLKEKLLAIKIDEKGKELKKVISSFSLSNLVAPFERHIEIPGDTRHDTHSVKVKINNVEIEDLQGTNLVALYADINGKRIYIGCITSDKYNEISNSKVPINVYTDSKYETVRYAFSGDHFISPARAISSLLDHHRRVDVATIKDKEYFVVTSNNRSYFIEESFLVNATSTANGILDSAKKDLIMSRIAEGITQGSFEIRKIQDGKIYLRIYCNSSILDLNREFYDLPIVDNPQSLTKRIQNKLKAFMRAPNSNNA